VMEVAARMGGGYTRDLVRAVYDIDMLRMLLDLHRGRVSVPTLVARGAVAAQRIVADRVSMVLGVSGLDRAVAEGSVRIVESESPKRRWGVFLGVPYSYGGTILAYFVTGGTPEEAACRASNAARKLQPRSISIDLPPGWYAKYLSLKRALQR
jgi:hypothetical protein